MKNLKIYLAVVSVLLFLSLGVGVYVWYLFQTVPLEGSPITTVTSLSPPLSQSSADEDEETTETTPPTPVIIETRSLTEGQRDALNTLGYTGETITLTTDMIVCATEALGSARINEILEGATPSVLESMRLLPCAR